MKRSLFVIALISVWILSFGQDEDKLMHALRTDNLEEFSQNFKKEYLFQPLGKDSLQALAYAAFFNSNKIAEWLTEYGANVNSFSGGLTPAMWAARAGNADGLKLLIKYRAGINYTDREGNTALIYASAAGCFECAAILVHAGADIDIINRYGYDAEFYAQRSRDAGIQNLLRFYRVESLMQGKELIDGPYVEWIESDKIRITYLRNKPNSNKVKVINKRQKIDDLPYRISGHRPDTVKYTIRKKYEPQEAIFDNVESIFVMGDIHGNYDETVTVLKNAGVLNEKMEWNWGGNHLLFIGDIFDRGDEVTELLWLIKSLQFQAMEAGGRVHLLFGNHELMIFSNDLRYISDKYFFLTTKTGINYSELFGDSHELGIWLRSLNTMVKINDILFVHAGVSGDLLERNMSLMDVNFAMRRFIADKSLEKKDSLGLFLAGDNGPLWFRGYQYEGGNDRNAVESIFNKSLEFYNAKKMIVGHTPSQNFRLDFGNKLIYIDVSSSELMKGEKALLIKDGRYYKIFALGNQEPLIE